MSGGQMEHYFMSPEESYQVVQARVFEVLVYELDFGKALF